jgi:hypothetical protein
MRAAIALLVLAGCSSGESDDTTAATFSALDARVFRPSCTLACHSGGEFAAGGLDLESDGHAALVDQPPSAAVCEGQPFVRVAPGQPQESLLYLKVMAKLDGTLPPCGDVMPPGADKPPVSTEDAEAIRDWIEAGAPND